MQFNHEKLDVYKVALEFLAFAYQIIKKIPPGFGFLADELKRSAHSSVVNIAEGSGKFSPKEKARYYKIARGSADESSATLDSLFTFQIITPQERNKGRKLLYREVCMLSKMIF